MRIWSFLCKLRNIKIKFIIIIIIIIIRLCQSFGVTPTFAKVDATTVDK